MDILDVRIFCAMGFCQNLPPSGPLDRRPSPGVIARNLGLDIRAVKARIKRMEAEGFIKHYQVLPNYDALGLACSVYAIRFDNPAAKREAVSKLRLVDGVVGVDEMANSMMVSLVFPAPSELQRQVALVKELIKVEPTKAYDIAMPRVQTKLSQTDWLIIKSLRYDALKPAKRIAEELGITVRTVNNRLQRLIRQRAFFIVPIVSVEKVAHLIFYAMFFFLDESRRKEAVRGILESFTNRSFNQVLRESGPIVFFMFAERMSECEDSHIAAKGIDGVMMVLMDFYRESHDFSECIDRLIGQKVAPHGTQDYIAPASARGK